MSAEYKLGAEASLSGKLSAGDLDRLQEASPRTFAVPAGKIADIEVGLHEKEMQLHSLGLVVGRGKMFEIPMASTLGLPTKEIANGGTVIRIANTGPLCQYCQAAADWLISPFR